VGVLCDYFAAGSDAEAAGVVDRPGGPAAPAAPGGPAAPASDERRSAPDGPAVSIGRQAAQSPEPVATDPRRPLLDTVSGWKIDPVVQLATMQEILTGRPYDEIVAEPRSGRDLVVRDGGARLVLTLPDSLLPALADASDERLAETAVLWAHTEEFWGEGDPRLLSVFLGELAALARRARSRNQRLYCWVCI
jgi:hypothetical protein